MSEAVQFTRQPTAPVPLHRLCAALALPEVAGSVTGVTLASGATQAGDLYAALPGAKTHGARFAAAAVARGAAAVLTDAPGAEIAGDLGVPVLVTDDPRGRLGVLSALVYGDPSTRLQTYGITGTNGKTTVTYMLAAALRAMGHPTGLIGTTGTYIDGQRVPTVRTTPEAPDLQALMAQMVRAGVTALAMEVSSHALVLGRVDGIRFDVAGFTNLSPDHLDFHDTMPDYYAAKAELFDGRRSARAVINLDDEWGRRLAGEATTAHTTYGMTPAADWHAEAISAGAAGSRFLAVGPDTRLPVSVGAPGLFNVANALGSLAMLAEAGHDPHDAAEALRAFSGVPGRMEVVPGVGPTVIVDYAHTPDAVERALDAIRPLTAGRIWCVIGCGGDRDAVKRPAMGRIAAQLSDHLIVTDDNPRSEEPAAIRAAVLSGARRVPGADVLELGDRGEAIAAAIRSARGGDTVMILGKGHETGQEIAGEIHPFDDRAVAADVLGALS